MLKAEYVSEINLNDIPYNTKKYYWLEIARDAIHAPIKIPVLIAKGKNDGPVLGLTAAIHGNELNGIPVIQRLFAEIDMSELTGIIMGVPIVNVPAFINKKRMFPDGVDLNHIMPGKNNGSSSSIYAYNFFEKIVKKFDYLLDLHTASFGRENTYYIRANMENPQIAKFALLQNAQIIVNNPPHDFTLRGSSEELGIAALTLELGNPNQFQKKLIRSGVEGIHNVLAFLKMTNDEIEINETEAVLCKNSYWIYTDNGGLLEVKVKLMDIIKKGQEIAILKSVFGKIIKTYYAPEAGIVIGRSVSPVAETGGRIIHLGIIK
jgi:hypothetical protein